MRTLWNLLAVIGLLALIAVGYGAYAYGPTLMQVRNLDPGAVQTYTGMFQRLLETGSSAEATVWKSKVADGLTFEEVDNSIQSIAAENNIKDVGSLPLSNQVEAMTGKPWRKVKIYLYCNPLTAAKMMDYDDAFAAYLPCRVTLVEDKTGQLWIYSLDMDMMIHGGKTLPDGLREEAVHVKEIIQDVMKRAAEGDF